MGGSSLLVIVGVWVAIIGYGVLYAGVQKLSGDPSYKLGMGFKGVAPTPAGATSASSPGTASSLIPGGFSALQNNVIPVTPLSQ